MNDTNGKLVWEIGTKSTTWCYTYIYIGVCVCVYVCVCVCVCVCVNPTVCE